MSLVKEKYRALAPRLEYLSDPVVLSLAWKKAAAYVRRHNWYADTLELDSSGLDLEGLTHRWASELVSGQFRTEPARLVPAPKNGRWGFSPAIPGGWGPLPTDGAGESMRDRLPLRPLAHLGIREQTAAAAVMLCLADCIETAQGNPAEAPTDAQSKEVYSYGNRLYCQWSDEDRRAQFAWGSADSYSRYYQDYQQFVGRSREVAAALEAKVAIAEQRIYVVKMDLSAFFDGIDIPLLINKLRAEYEQFTKADPTKLPADDQFWLAAGHILTMKWATADEERVGLLKGGALPKGLPQGLMASGFLANAYLLDFDRAMGKACAAVHKIRSKSGLVKIHDYCRYVDDLRLVVSVEAEISPAIFETWIAKWVQSVLDKSLGVRTGSGALQLNPDKTESELLSHVAGATSVVSRMRQVQQQLSGPFDLSSLEELETALNGLLSMADAESAHVRTPAKGELPPLAVVARPPMDVRDDTLTRFAAYRLCKSLRHRRLLTDLTETQDGRTTAELLRQDFEMTARRLVGSWAENPSLVQVLRYAFDLYPGPELLADVLEALDRKIQLEAEAPDQAAVAWYVLAELFRAGALETGKLWMKNEGVAIGDLTQYRLDLAAYAEGLLQVGDCPWYVRQQAALLLATLNSPSILVGEDRELARYKALHHYLRCELPPQSLSELDLIGSAVIGFQLTGDVKHFQKWLRKLLGTATRDAVSRVFERIYRGSSSLFDAITVPGQGSIALSKRLLTRNLALHVDSRWPEQADALNGAWMPLSRVITHSSRPFQHENSLLRLAVAIVGLESWAQQSEFMYSVFDLEVRCSDWQLIDDPEGPVLDVRLTRSSAKKYGPRSPTPAWCRAELAWQYATGTILRAAAVGSNDYTLSWRLGVDEIGWYRGLPSTAARRQVGMLHTSQALGGTVASVTPWFSSLLGTLLRWPGLESNGESHEAEAARRPNQFMEILEKRLSFQRLLFGRSSGAAVYRYPVSWTLREDSKLRVAVVQGLLPKHRDFEKYGLDGLDRSPFRESHRNHTATLLRLAAKKLGAYESLHDKRHKPVVDLVVLPEYGVHVDDQDLLRAFSDETGAMIHYGLLGAMHPVLGKHTNASRWLIPSRTSRRRSWIEVDQGKKHLTDDEVRLGVIPWCPYRVVIELKFPSGSSYRMVGAICFDATDLSLAADLKNESHLFLVPASNRDIKTFDSMAAALRYHMYQHVVICNTGEFGGSTAQAPYDAEHRRTISHSHGVNQIAVSVFEIEVDDFGPSLKALERSSEKKPVGKSPPAGLHRRP